MDRLRALRFALGRGRPVAHEQTVPLAGGRARLLAGWGTPRGTLVAVHGMSPLGEADPRWVHALRGLARAGFRVVSPHFPDIAALEIRASQPAAVAAAVRAVAADPDLAPDGRVGLFSASFSGALCLHAAATPDLAPRVRGVCAIGTYGDLGSTLRHLFGDRPQDPYALVIVLANYVERVEPLPGAAVALGRAARACFERDGVDPVPHLGDAPASTRARLVQLLEDPEARLALLARIRTTCAADFAALDPRPALARIQAPLTLVHGAGDAVIPAEQSRLLARVRAEAGAPCRLAVTHLLSHGDRRLSPGVVLREGPALVDALGGFFGDCAGG